MTLQLPNPSHNTSCYSIDGLLSPYDPYTYIPCNLTAIAAGQHSACCAPGDKCLVNGLCEYGGNNPNHANEFWRIGCTDKTYNDPACPKYCENIEPDDPHLANHLVFQCPETGKWCCATGYLEDFPKRGTYNTTCCDIADLAFSIEGDTGSVYTTATLRLDLESLVSSTASEAEASITIVTSSMASTRVDAKTTAGVYMATELATAPTTSSSSTFAPDNTASHDLKLGLGFGLGIPLTVAFIIGLFALLYRFRRSNPSPKSTLTKSTRPWLWTRRRGGEEKLGEASQEDLRRTHPHAFQPEILSKELRAELDASREPVEVWSPGVKQEGWGVGVGGADGYR